MEKATLICDLQFGSTGKGLIAGYLAKRDKPDTLVTAWSANAGHTYIDETGRKFIHTMLANGIVSPNFEVALIGPGSQLNVDNLMREIDQNRDILGKVPPVFVHENACVIQQEHIDIEAGPMTKIGSTKKGCGAALIDKIRRNPDKKTIIRDWLPKGGASGYFSVVTHAQYMDMLNQAEKIQIEGAQGYSLGINSGLYPYVTSRECTTAQILSDTVVPIKMLAKVVGSARTFPIRVANRHDENGTQIGYSGPCYEDQHEIEWAQIGIKPELTTVTKLPRRIFTFSEQQITEAIQMSGVDEVFLNFVNYLPNINERTAMIETVSRIADEQGGKLAFLGLGPNQTAVVEI